MELEHIEMSRPGTGYEREHMNEYGIEKEAPEVDGRRTGGSEVA